MKKIYLIIAVLFVAVNVYASPVVSSGEKTADALIRTGSGFFSQIVIMPDGTNDVTVTIYNNTSASGDKILPTMTFDGSGGPQASPPTDIHFTQGVYVDITTAGTVAYTILYRDR